MSITAADMAEQMKTKKDNIASDNKCK